MTIQTLFLNQTTDGISEIFEEKIGYSNIQIRHDITGVLGTAKIELEALRMDSETEWFTTGDVIEGSGIPRVQLQKLTTGKFRFRISNAGGGTNITIIKSLTETRI